MGRFKVHVQHITYGWCGIELYINDKRIQYTASYMGSNPLAYLIGVCWEFCIAKRDGGIEGEEYLEECKDTWYSEPDSMKISLKLDRNDVVFLDIQARDGIDDDKCTVVEGRQLPDRIDLFYMCFDPKDPNKIIDYESGLPRIIVPKQ